MDYEVCWHGATWRELTPEVTAAPVIAPTKRRYARTVGRSQAMIDAQARLNSHKVQRTTRAIESALCGDWQTHKVIAKRSRRSESATRFYLRAFITAGTVEVKMVHGGPGRPLKLYRRRQVQQEAA